MRAEFQKEFDNKFVLEETNIRKLKEIILNRVPEGNIQIEVKKADGVQYETQDFEEMLATESSSWTKTSSIAITFRANDNNASIRRIKLAFDKPQTTYSFLKGLTLLIQGEKVDDVNLLGDDLVKYLESSVVKPKLDPIKIFLSAALIFVVITFVVYAQGVFEPLADSGASPHKINELSTNSEKLDYLIELQTKKENKESIVVMIGVGFIAIILIVLPALDYSPSQLWHKFFPKYVYALGIEATEYKKLTNLKKNVFWTVIVGAGISTVTGFIVWYMTKQ